MTVPIDRDLVQQLIEIKYGSVDQLAADWETLYENKSKKIIRSRDRSTIYKWLDTGLPARQEIIFGFCALLDVDPIGIMQSDKVFIETHFAKERRAWQMSKKDDTILAPFRAMYLPGWLWPNRKLAENFYHRPWFTAEHLYEPGEVKNVYAALKLRQISPENPICPRVYHIAYKQKGAIDQLWRPYGVLIARNHSIRLIAESGDWQELGLQDATIEAVAETFFGPRATRFKLASLHSFALDIDAPSDDPTFVRFK